MKMDIRCLQCNVQQMIKIADFTNVSEAQKEHVARQLFGYLKEVDFKKSNPEIMKGTWQIITEGFGTFNPYQTIKAQYNNGLLAMYEEMKELLKTSSNPFESALKMAAMGNIIDFGPSHSFSQEGLIKELKSLEDRKVFEIDNGEQLYQQLKNAKELLYIGDNCGEIVLDKLFIEVIGEMFPELDIHFSVRGMPILNDVTKVDAEMVGMNNVAKIIENGDGAPGTVLEQTSLEFQAKFNSADVVIAKGQGNYEGLSDMKREGLFLVLMAKCSLVSENIGVETMKCVCIENR